MSKLILCSAASNLLLIRVIFSSRALRRCSSASCNLSCPANKYTSSSCSSESFSWSIAKGQDCFPQTLQSEESVSSMAGNLRGRPGLGVMARGRVRSMLADEKLRVMWKTRLVAHRGRKLAIGRRTRDTPFWPFNYAECE